MADDEFFLELLSVTTTGGRATEKSWSEFHELCDRLEEGKDIKDVIGVGLEEGEDGKEGEAGEEGGEGGEGGENEIADKNSDKSDTDFGRIQKLLNDCKLNSYNWESLEFSDYGTTKTVPSLVLSVMVGKIDVAQMLIKHDKSPAAHREAVNAACVYDRPKTMQMMINSQVSDGCVVYCSSLTAASHRHVRSA